jgi:hypothetical protein
MNNKTIYMLIASLAALIGVQTSFGQETIKLTSLTNAPLVIADAAEFSRVEAGSIWDMDKLRDIPFENGILQPTVSDGIWSAASAQAGASAGIYLLNGGIPNPPHKFHPTWVSDMTPYGGLNPIEAQDYYRFSIRMAMDSNQRGTTYVTWSSDPDVAPSSLGDTDHVGAIGVPDSRPAYSSSATPVQIKYPTGYRIIDVDLMGAYDNSEYVDWLSYPPANPTGKDWDGKMYSLMVIPSTESQVGAEFKIDWARLYNPFSGTNITVTWKTEGVNNDNYYAVSLYIDDDNSGYDGTILASGIRDDGNFTFNSGLLPPGSYYIYVAITYHGNSAITDRAFSEYSSEIRIDYPPMFTFSSPSYTSGVDYATAELNNPWDMNDASDIESIHDVAGITYQNGTMAGTALSHPKDPSIFFNLSKNGTHIPIDTTKYHYLTYRMSVDYSQIDSLFERMIHGWLAKVTWWNSSLVTDGTYSRDLHIYEDMRSYSMDLNDRDLANPNYSYAAGWKEISQANVFRIDPLEADMDVPFVLDDVKICADNEPSGGKFTIKWNCTDADDTNLTVTLYYGYQTELGYQESTNPIATINQAPGTNQFVWDTFGLQTENYYIRAEVTDGINTNSFISQLPVVIDTGIPRMDVDGYDPTVFDTSDGYWYILYGNSGADAIQWGWSSVEPVSGDYNGDGTNDLAVFDQATGRWFIQTREKKILAWSVFWGWPGVRPVPGDYNGNGTNDLAIFDQNTGRWFIETVDKQEIAWSIFWGWPGVDPIPGDYDGDGINDLAIFDQNTGRWFIRNLSGDVILWEAFWGWPGVTPVPGDYDGDGIDDLAIFDQNTGRWFIRKVSGEILLWEDWWGFAGCTPVPGDYDNDGIADRVVYYEDSGMWYFNFSSGKPNEIAGPWRGKGTIPVSGNFDGK